MYPNLAYLAQSYFHQDFQDEADEPIEVVEKFRDSESAEMTEALRAELVALLDSGATEDDLSRIWLDDGGAYYDPAYDEITVREWLSSVVEALDGKADPPAQGTAESSGPGIPFKGSTGL